MGENDQNPQKLESGKMRPKAKEPQEWDPEDFSGLKVQVCFLRTPTLRDSVDGQMEHTQL